jgi:hypothetical protein
MGAKRPSQAKTFHRAAVFLKLGDSIVEGNGVIGRELYKLFERGAATFRRPAHRNPVLAEEFQGD